MKDKIKKIIVIIAILLVSFMLIPQGSIKVYASEDKDDVVLFKGEAKAKGGWDPWETVTDIKNFNVKDFEEPFVLKISYKGSSAPLVIFQSWTGGTSWGQVAPAYFSKGVAYYTKDAICDKYGTDFSKLNNISIKPNGSDVTVTSVILSKENDSEVNINYKGTAGEIINNINVGWNLGNTLESQGDWIEESTNGTPEDFETAWCNPVTTKAMIDKVKAAGFNAIRIPVTWTQHIDDNNNYTVDKKWMDRVQEVVNYAISDGMYCIINVHHDADDRGWLWASNNSIKKNSAKFKRLWQQISERFKDYDNHLLFEGFNEMLDENFNWQYPGTEATSAVNTFNQMFVDTVRSTGGNNATRCLVVNTYAGSTDGNVIDDFVLPKDTVENSLIVQVHCYLPYQYASSITDSTKQTAWKENGGKNEVDGVVLNLYNHVSSKNIPIMIGEIAAANKENTADRADYASYVVNKCRKYGIKCFWWDNGGTYDKDETYGYYTGMGLLNRRTLKWVYPEIVKAFTGVDPDKSVVKGDVNGDGTISLVDYVKLQKYILDNNSSKIDINAGDMNNDGIINVKDLYLLKSKLIN